MKKIVTGLLLLASIFNEAEAQTPDEIKQTFPGTDMVYQNYDQELRFFMKNGVPVAERTSNIDMLMLTEKNSNMLSKYAVHHSGYNSLTNLEAYTRVPNGSKYRNVNHTDQKTASSSSDNIFYDDMKETTFNFSSLTQNAIAHVNYTQFLKDAHLMTPFFLPSYMPVINSSYTVVVPNNISVKYIVKNDPTNVFQFSEEKKKRETVYKWTVKNRKSLDNYYNAPDSRYFEPHIIIYISSFEDGKGPQSFLNTIEDLYKWNISFLKELNLTPDNALKLIVDSLTKGVTDEKTKAQHIYQWVQHHIRYVAFEDGLEGFRPRQAGEVCAKRYGDCKDMSSIITQMMRMAGIKAYYTWIGTRSLPYRYSETPLPLVDNHMISTAFINGSWMFFDGTDPNAKFDMPPAFIQGKEALVSISDSKYEILTVPVINSDRNTLTDSTFIRIADNGILGSENVRYNGYFGKEVYASLLYRDEKETKEYINKRMAKGSNNFILGKYDVVRTNPEDNIAHIKADFELPGYYKKVGNEYYINLNLEKILENQLIDTVKRKVPVETEYNYHIMQYHILDIPAGYKVAYLPKDFSFENDLLHVNFYYKVENQQVIAAQEVRNKKLIVNPSDFAEWNKPMKAIQSYYKESVVLEKN